jgi:hypothetical protein
MADEPQSQTLHAWTNECDYVAAKDLDDARRVYAEFCDPDACEETMAFEALPDDKIVSWWLGADGKVGEPGEDATLVNLTCRELVDRHGRAYLGSTEW